MYKVLSVIFAGLLVFSVRGSSSSGVNAALPTPSIIARVSLKAQTGAIPSTTLFTPTATGIYRISAYMCATNLYLGSGGYNLQFNWTDDAGNEQAYQYFFLANLAAPQAWGYSQYGAPGNVTVLEASAGQPVSYSTNGSDEEYSLYLVAERLQ